MAHTFDIQWLDDRWQIHDLLCRFQSAFDMQDWAAMRACLCDEIFVDYSSFRAEAPGAQRADDFVQRRRTALSALHMQHNFLNLQLTRQDESRVAGTCNYLIMRFAKDGQGATSGFFHSYGRYVFRFCRQPDAWRIAHIEQHLLASEGDAALHAGARAGQADSGASGRR